MALVVEGGEGVASVTRPLTPLVGRADQVAELSALLSVSPLLTLIGAPGVGKSRLAIEVTHHLHSSGSRPAVFVPLGGQVTAHDVDRIVSGALGDTGGASAPRELDCSGLTVVLDDCDRVLGACAETARALAARGLRVLATAREPLRADGELVWRLPPLSLPRPGHHELASLLADSDAARLFVERAESASAAFVPLPDHADHIAEICRRLDGIPLAIELAARNVVAYSPAEIAAHLEDPFSLLTGGVRTAHPRHHSLWACLAWSYDALSSSEQLLFERLSVFHGSFGDDSALEVSAPDEMGPGEVSRVLRALVDKSLIGVEPVGTGTRYRLLQTIRQFAAAKLGTAGDEDEARDRHARWCARSVEAAGDPRVGRAWHRRLAPLHEDIHAALDFAVTTKHADIAIVLGGAESRLGAAERPSNGWEALTQAEQKVAELVAQGKTNIEVAGELRIAPATVKAHLRHVFAKMGVPTRTSLAAEVLGRPRR